MKMMRWFRLLCLLFFLPHLLHGAKLSFTDSIVKIKSYYNSPSFPPRIGSGMFIQWHGHNYILTSDHVIYHSNKSFIHEMTDSQGRKQLLNYFVSDAGRGLALLQLKTDDSTLPAFSLDSTNETPPVIQESITMIGYPADSDAVLVNKKGKLNNIKYSSDIFVETLNLLEVKSGYGEFGMSGGAAFSAQGEYRGLLSHQIIKTNSENVVLLISAADVRTWIENLLTSEGHLKSPSPLDLFQDPVQQVSEFLSYRSVNLYFSFSQPYGSGTPLALTLISSKNQSTEKLYGGDQGPFINLVFKPEFNLICLGFRSAKVLGSIMPSPDSINPWLRKAIDPTIELLWSYDGAGVVANVKKARSYHSDFANFVSKLSQVKAPRLVSYLDTIAFYLESNPTDDTRQDSADEQALGNWRLIKAKDLDYILNDPSLEKEWAEVAKISMAQPIQQKLRELRAIMVELTL